MVLLHSAIGSDADRSILTVTYFPVTLWIMVSHVLRMQTQKSFPRLCTTPREQKKAPKLKLNQEIVVSLTSTVITTLLSPPQTVLITRNPSNQDRKMKIRLNSPKNSVMLRQSVAKHHERWANILTLKGQMNQD